MLRQLASLILMAFTLSFTPSALAKQTLFSKEEVIQSVMNSTELEVLTQSYGSITYLDANEIECADELQSFQLTLVLTVEAAFGDHANRSCFFEGIVQVGRDANAPAGIVASRIMEPAFGPPLCQK